MSGYSKFAKNVGILTIASFGTKILSFLLVPLYTSILTTSDYGTYDLIYNTISLLIPILTQNILDAVLRFSIGCKPTERKIISIGIKYFLIATAIVVGALFANSLCGLSKTVRSLSVLVVLMFVTQALSQIVLYYARGLNKFLDVAVSSVLCSAVAISANVLLLVVFRLGLQGYFLANILGPAIQIIYLVARLSLLKVDPIHVDRGLEKSMLKYCRPLTLNSVAWWVNNAADRYIVTFFCGTAENGIYSVASKIPSILSIFQTIIGQAWTISAVDEFDADDKDGFFSNMYSIYNCLMVLACALIIAADVPFASLLYSNSFFEAWRYVPFLTISVVFGALAGYVGGILAAVKDSKEFARSSTFGALSNVLINLVLVPWIGPLGSAIATAISYWITWILRMRVLDQYIHMKLTPARDGVSYGILVLQSFILLVLFDRPLIMYLCEALCVGVLFLMYREEIARLFARALSRMRR